MSHFLQLRYVAIKPLEMNCKRESGTTVTKRTQNEPFLKESQILVVHAGNLQYSSLHAAQGQRCNTERKSTPEMRIKNSIHSRSPSKSNSRRAKSIKSVHKRKRLGRKQCSSTCLLLGLLWLLRPASAMNRPACVCTCFLPGM